MMTRPFIILLLSAIASDADAERRRRDRDRDRDDEEAESLRDAKRAISGDERRRAERELDEADDDEPPPRKKKSKKQRGGRVAQAPGETASDDVGEARAIVAIELDELIEVAVRHAPQLARAKLERKAAKGDAGAARIEQAWVLNAKAEYTQRGIGGDVDVGLGAEVKSETLGGSLGLGRKLPTGGSLSLDVDFKRIGQEFAISKEAINAINGDQKRTDDLKEFATRHQAFAGLSLTQPLLRGIGTNVALQREKKADLYLSEATLNAQIAAEDMVFEVVKAYWELAYASHALDTALDSLALAERHEKLTREEIRAGASPTSALNAVTYEIATREEAALRAQSELEAKSLELRRKAGLDLDDRSLVMRPGEPFAVGDEELEVGDMLAASRRANRRIVALAMRRRSADIDVKVAKNAMLPQLDLGVRGGLVGAGATSNIAFSNATGGEQYEVMASLTFSWELSGAARDAHAAAIARRSQIEVERLDIQRQIDTEVVAAVSAVKAARARVGFTEKAILVAEENVKEARAQFQAQRSTNFDVMRRQSELAEATLRRGRAVADYHIAVAQLQKLSGMLLEKYRVNVRPVGDR